MLVTGQPASGVLGDRCVSKPYVGHDWVMKPFPTFTERVAKGRCSG
jgi:hypothetical protein